MPENFVFVASAYAAIWLVLFVYLLALGSKLKRVEKQIFLLKEKEQSK